MSTFNPNHTVGRLYEAADSWGKQSLLAERSLFNPAEAIWTSEFLDELDQKFNQNPDEGGDNFLGKLKRQLASASPAAVKLMAELLWVHSLFPSNVGPVSKRETITEVWSWAGDGLELSQPLLSDEVLGGIGSAGTAYNAHKWRELAWLITCLRALRLLDPNAQHEILTSGQRFIKWLSEQPGANNRQLLNILPHLLFPDEFERISSRGDKEKILASFTPEGKSIWRKRAVPDLDRALLTLRQELEAEKGSPIDFYSDDLKRKWRSSDVVKDAVDEGANVSFASALTSFLLAYDAARSGAFSIDGDLGLAMSAVRQWLERCPVIAAHKTLKVKMSVGQGGWTKTPWVAILDERLTTSTQRGIYIVFLIAEDLSITYLTLNQGMTDLVSSKGQQGAAAEMVRVAESARPLIAGVLGDQFKLDNAIKLKSDTLAARNYEIGTITHAALPRDEIPDDESLSALLGALVEAYQRVIDAQHSLSEVVSNKGQAEAPKAFTVDDALEEIFLEREEVTALLLLWRAKKNLVLQGPPGVGKSFAAQRLAYALIGAADQDRVGFVQFHQSYSYEDFVQGYRPSEEGFSLRDGKFVAFCERALAEPEKQFVFIIDEINRGNLSRILGELMLLIESDKREAKWAMPLAYSDAKSETDIKFYVPANIHLLGLMNTADRSLAVVDYALRRRFAFLDLSPRIHTQKFAKELAKRGVSAPFIQLVRERVGDLNTAIIEDVANLGPGFAIGHSFFCAGPVAGENSEAWYRRVIQTEILPLLREYWFDAPAKFDTWTQRLLA